MDMYIKIERTTEPLDQRHCTGLRGLSSEPCLLNQLQGPYVGVSLHYRYLVVYRFSIST